MKAACYTRTGPAHEVLRLLEFGDPIPKAGEVRVRMSYSGINPADVKRRAGEACRPPEFPIIIPHSDGAGYIDAVGPRVSPSRIGERVWTWNAQWKWPFGTAAEYAVVNSAQAVPLPANCDLRHGAVLGVPALTAAYIVQAMDCVPGDVVLVSGGGGVIGKFVTQMVKDRGATVIAVVRRLLQRDAALGAGADYVTAVETDHVARDVLDFTNGAGITKAALVDLNDDLRYLPTVCAEFSTVVVYGSASNMIAPVPVLPLQLLNVTVRFLSGSQQPPHERSRSIEVVTMLLESGILVCETPHFYDLEEIAAAHGLVESGNAQGKVILRVGPDSEY